MSEEKVKNHDEMMQDTLRIISDSGIEVSDLVAGLVIKAYLKAKKETLLEGLGVHEPDVGITSPSWRKIGNGSTTMTKNKGFTSKLVVNPDWSLRDRLDQNLLKDDLYRERVGASDFKKQ